MSIRSIHHVQLAMPSGGEDRASEFYEAGVGLDRIAKPPELAARGGCWFRNEHVEVHLGVETDFEPARKAHPAFVVDDLDSLRQKLEDMGYLTRIDENISGFDRFYADDPFGNRIEFLQER